ncbi:hypothetical protein N9Y42_07770 [Mariniblastus sp.]|nr:hypothetical protein [Mariniblastus sp.]
MIRLPAFALLFCLPFAGCSAMIAQSGFDLQSLTTKTDVLLNFGMPIEADSIESSQREAFVTRRKISDPIGSSSNGLGFAMSFGLLEPLGLAKETREIIRNSLFGDRLEFEYDSEGFITKYPNPHLSKYDPWLPRLRKHNGG